MISYIINQLINLQLWNSNFYLIFIFEMNKYLEGNMKSIMYSLFRIRTFIKQYKLKGKTKKNISQITEFGFTAWKFILAIYKAR